MFGEIGDHGYLKIDNEKDRLTVANILFANGYTVTPVRKRKNGRSFDYYLKYELKDRDLEEFV